MGTEEQEIWAYPSVKTAPIYELETWVRSEELEENTEEDYLEMLERDGYLADQVYEKTIGYYPTKKRAEQDLQEYCEYAYDEGKVLSFAFIRQKAMYMQISPCDYLKEWSYMYGECVDESLVRNYDTDDYPFFGRPEDMIHHKVGDIVRCVAYNEVFWGIVCSLPPTEEWVKVVNEKARKSGKWNGESIMDFSDDQYVILTNGGDYMESHEHILSHHVFRPDMIVPEYVRELLLGEHKYCDAVSVTLMPPKS